MNDDTEGVPPKIQSMFDRMPNKAVPTNDFEVHWSMKGIGWGGYRFYMEDGVLHIDNEMMSKDSIKKVLGIMVDAAVLDDPIPDPPKAA